MKVKGAKKIANGAPLARNRFRRIGMLAGGTGVAPFMHLVATLLADPEDATLLDLRCEDFQLAKSLLAWFLWLLNPAPLPSLS